MTRVLVVDDSASIRYLIRTNLEIAGIEVDEASDGQECLDFLKRAAALPDLVTLDIVMPRRDGISTLHDLQADPRTKQLPVVVVTTMAQAVDVKRGLDAGAHAYLTKPFDPDHLVSTIESILGITDTLGR